MYIQKRDKFISWMKRTLLKEPNMFAQENN